MSPGYETCAHEAQASATSHPHVIGSAWAERIGATGTKVVARERGTPRARVSPQPAGSPKIVPASPSMAAPRSWPTLQPAWPVTPSSWGTMGTECWTFAHPMAVGPRLATAKQTLIEVTLDPSQSRALAEAILHGTGRASRPVIGDESRQAVGALRGYAY